MACVSMALGRAQGVHAEAGEEDEGGGSEGDSSGDSDSDSEPQTERARGG